MSKSLKKLIDINRLREFKNKLVGTGSAYVQTGAVDQTVAGTKTFSEPIVGSVTGSSGSCTGNAATATTATTAKACTGNAATATKLATARSLWGNNFDGSAAITGVITGTPAIEFVPSATTSNNGGYLDFHYNQSAADCTSRIIESASGTLSINSVTITTGKVVTATTFNGALKGNVTGNCSGSSGSCTGNAATATTATTAQACTGNAATATKLATARTIALSGAATGTATGFDGSGNIAIPVTSLDASKLTGTASVSTTGNAATATTAATATNATYTNWLRTSSHSDHLFHTEWDGAGYFWTYVTAGNGDYRAVRVARSDSAANADHATSADSATRATSADRASAVQTSDYHEITFDWDSQVPGYVGLRVDTTDMGGIVTTNRLVSAIRAQWYATYPDGAEAHNAMWGGRDITAAFNNGTVSANIANGTFRDIFPGDYITKQVTISGTAYTVNWVVADCDYWINKGDTAMTTHHVVIVPQAPIFDARMNATNTTEGGYAGSDMHRNVINACYTGIVNAFGSSHILMFRDGISNRVDASVSSGITQWTGTPGWWGEWVSAYCNLMSEKMVYGAPICAAGAMDNSVATRQMSAFRLSERLINYNRQWWWLRDVVSSESFAAAGDNGSAGTGLASYSFGVRPFALLR